MKKLKVMIVSMLGAIALVFACVFGTRVSADTTYSLTGTEIIEGLGLSGSSKAMDGTQLKSFFTFTGGKMQSASASKTYTNPEGIDFTNSYSASAKPTNDTAITITLAITASMGSAKAYVYAYASGGTPSITVGSESASTIPGAGSVFVGDVDSDNNTIVTTKSGCIHAIYVVFTETKTVASLDSLTVNKTYKVDDEVAKNDLTLMGTYEGESSDEITKFTFEVFKYVDGENDTKVEGAFTTAGTYYVKATSTETPTVSIKSANFVVGEKTKFVYDLNDYAVLNTFNVKGSDDKYVIIDSYNTTDNVITFNDFRRCDNNKAYTWTDEHGHSTNGLQGSTMTITLNKAAKVTIYATQTSSNESYAERCMYFADENDNTLMSDFHFSLKTNTITNLKVCSINLDKGTYSTYSTAGVFNIYDIVIDYTDSTSLDTSNMSMIIEHSDGNALVGDGKAVRFVGILKNVDYADITSITLDLVLTLNDTNNTVKNANGIVISSVYTGLPGYNDDDTLYFYFSIKGVEADTYKGCTIKCTATIVIGNAKGINTTLWTNPNA